jgi:hypothetical protein
MSLELPEPTAAVIETDAKAETVLLELIEGAVQGLAPTPIPLSDRVSGELFGSIKTMLADKRVGYHAPKPKCGRMDYGWFWPSHQVIFRCLLTDSTKVILELGSFLGRSTNFLLQNYGNAVVFAVDLWDNEYLKADDHYQTSEQQVIASYPLYETFLVNTWQYRLRISKDVVDKKFYGLVPMRMSTLQALAMLHEHGVTPDFIYVDANHHYDAVLEDVETCLRLFPNSAICGDDYDYKDVRRAVHHIAKIHNLKVTVEEGKVFTYLNDH